MSLRPLGVNIPAITYFGDVALEPRKIESIDIWGTVLGIKPFEAKQLRRGGGHVVFYNVDDQGE